MNQKVYLSGQISGLPYETARAIFAMVEETYKAEGYEVLNPTNNGLNPDAEWTEHMIVDIKMMLDADIVVMLPGWRESKGATLEHHIATNLKMSVFYIKSH